MYLVKWHYDILVLRWTRMLTKNNEIYIKICHGILLWSNKNCYAADDDRFIRCFMYPIPWMVKCNCTSGYAVVS